MIRAFSVLACTALLLGFLVVCGPSWAACDGASALKSWAASEITGPAIGGDNPLLLASETKAPTEAPAKPSETASPSTGQQKSDQPSSPPKGATDPAQGSASTPPVKEAPGGKTKVIIKDDQGC